MKKIKLRLFLIKFHFVICITIVRDIKNIDSRILTTTINVTFLVCYHGYRIQDSVESQQLLTKINTAVSITLLTQGCLHRGNVIVTCLEYTFTLHDLYGIKLT